jgi:membrane protease YdiL (CAAX protease family)
MGSSALNIFALSFILVLLIVWAYFFVYSHRNNIDLPWGFGIVIAGHLVAGYAFNTADNNFEKINISVSLPFLVSLFGIAWNIVNIREQFYMRELKWFLQLMGIGLIPGLLVGFCSAIALGFEYFQYDHLFTPTALILATIQISVAEEIITRGYFLSYLRKNGFGAWFAIIFQSIIFAVAHVPRYFGDGIALLINFLVGMVAGYLTWKTKSLIPAIVFHIFSNLIGIVWWLVVR